MAYNNPYIFSCMVSSTVLLYSYAVLVSLIFGTTTSILRHYNKNVSLVYNVVYILVLGQSFWYTDMEYNLLALNNAHCLLFYKHFH